MNRKHNVCNESTNTTSTTGRPALVVVNAPTLLDGIGELARMGAALERSAEAACGLLVVRRSERDRTFVAAYPDPALPVGAIEVEYMNLDGLVR